MGIIQFPQSGGEKVLKPSTTNVKVAELAERVCQSSGAGSNTLCAKVLIPYKGTIYISADIRSSSVNNSVSLIVYGDIYTQTENTTGGLLAGGLDYNSLPLGSVFGTPSSNLFSSIGIGGGSTNSTSYLTRTGTILVGAPTILYVTLFSQDTLYQGYVRNLQISYDIISLGG